MSVFQDFCKDYSLEDNTSLSFKFNLNEYSPEEVMQFAENIFWYVSANSHGNHLFYMGGFHYNGLAELPHCHLHFCVQHWHTDTHESRRRNKHSPMPERLSCKISKLNDAEHLEKHLSYPCKENKLLKYESRGILHRIVIIPENVQLFLVKNGVALYELSLASKRKKARASERSGTMQQQLVELMGDRSYSNYHDYKVYIYAAYYNGLELNEYPDTSLLRKEIEKVAIKLKVVPPHYFDKN